MTKRPKTILLRPERLKGLIVELLVGAGASPHNADCAAGVHLEADLRGVGGQGIDYLPYTLASLERGLVDGQAGPEIVRRSPAAAVIDGRRGLGQVAAMAAVELAAELAASAGSATVAVRNSTDIYMIGYYSELLARSGCVAIVTTSGPPLVHPHGGTERLLSTNPIAFGFPRSGADPFVFDMATSAVASWRVRQAAYEGEALPEGSGRGPDGEPTTDPALIRTGAISPLAGHKGFGLALSLGLLCGPLTESGIGPELAGWQASGETHTQGHLFVAIDPGALGSPAGIAARADRYLDLIRNSTPAPDMDGIRIPGERGFETRARQVQQGVEVLVVSLENLRPFAEKYGILLPLEDVASR